MLASLFDEIEDEMLASTEFFVFLGKVMHEFLRAAQHSFHLSCDL